MQCVDLAANAVTAAKILDANVTADKLDFNAVTTAKINLYNAAVPAAGAGIQGQIQFTDSHLYMCTLSVTVAGNDATWREIPTFVLTPPPT